MPRQVASGGARVGFAQQGLELGEDLLDRVEVGRVARQEEQLGTGAADQLANRLALMCAGVTHDDNVAGEVATRYGQVGNRPGKLSAKQGREVMRAELA